MIVQHFFDTRTNTLTYVVSDEASKAAVVVDSVTDYDPCAGRIFTDSAETVANYIDEQGLSVAYVLDTHVHADHMSAIAYFRQRYGAKSVIGQGVQAVQESFKKLLNLGDEFTTDGSQFDVLLDESSVLEFGPLTIRAIPTGGHTPASVSYLIGDALFVGDSIFQPDAGTARTDFPGGSSEELYESVQRIFALPDETRIFTLHDYQPGGRELEFMSTVAQQRESNIHVNERVSKAEFVALRDKLQVAKPAPTLLFPAVQVNIRAGELPSPESNGRSYLKIPMNAINVGAPR